MIILEVTPILQNIDLICSIVFGLVTLATTIYAIIQKIKAGNYKGAMEDADALMKQGVQTIDQIKTRVDGTDARLLVRDVLKEQGKILEGLDLKNKMDAKLVELGLNENS